MSSLDPNLLDYYYIWGIVKETNLQPPNNKEL